jgi:dCTP diphosphatase
MNIENLLKIQREFVAARDWDQFHTPKNLSTALMVEAGELAEIFQWMTTEESHQVMHTEKQAAKVREELADVFFFVLRLSDKLGVDLESAFTEKMKKNNERYPAEWARGHATKYTERE